MRQKKKILIVDDDLAIRLTFRYVFMGGPWEVETAETGEAALQELQENDFDIAFLDYRLPGMNGIEVVHEAQERKINVPIIIISAHLHEEALARAAKTPGVVGVLAKPIDPNDLRSMASKDYAP